MLCRIMACKSCQPSYVMSRHIMSCHDHLYLHLFFTKQIGFNIAPKEDTTLNEMLVLGLDKFVEELTEISGRAAKEFSLEKVCKSYHNHVRHIKCHLRTGYFSALKSGKITTTDELNWRKTTLFPNSCFFL